MDNDTTLFAFDVVDSHLPEAAPTVAPGKPNTKSTIEACSIVNNSEGITTASCATISTIEAPTLVALGHPSASDRMEHCAGTPPISIAMSKSASQERAAAKQEKGNDLIVVNATPRAGHVLSRNTNKKKKRAQKRSAFAALNTVRGFTPATSADEDSDFSTQSIRGRKAQAPSTVRTSSVVRKDLNLVGWTLHGHGPDTHSSSPSSLSVLSQQFDRLRSRSPSSRPTATRSKSKLASETPSSASVTSETEGDEDDTQITSYEVNLENDFISSDVSDKERRDARQDPMFNGGVVRKMQAADFEPLRCLGKGTYGTVLLVKQVATGRLYAQKQFRKASLTVRKHLIEQTKTERAILESINRHPFVVKLFYAFQDHEKLYLILEYAQGGELFERMRTERMFPESTAAFYMAELVLALDHLHTTVGVVYRDLKPENCLLDADGHLLLTDFGLSKVAIDGDYRCRSMTGTMEYMAPEIIQGNEYDTAVDWWSLGILCFDLLTGSSPFRANNDLKVKEKILKAKLVLPYFLSPDAKDLLTRLLRKEPRKRLGSNMPKDMQTIRKHRFFRKIDWAQLDKRALEAPIKPLITDPALAENFSAEFTDLAVSPVRDVSHWDSAAVNKDNDPFGGFSFVGSRSLLETETCIL